MDKVLSKFSKGDELELRLQKVTKDMWENLYKNIVDYKPVISQTIVFGVKIDKNTSNRQVVPFENGKRVKGILYERKKVLGYHFVSGFKLNLARETGVLAFSANDASMIRIRLRASTLLPDIPNWRLDMSLIREVSPDHVQHLKQLKTQMLYELDPKDMLTKGPLAIATRYEIELEYQGGDTPSKAALDDVMQKLKMRIDPELEEREYYKGYLLKVARPLVNDTRLSFFKRRNGFKQLGSAAKEINRNTYFREVLPNIDRYYLTDKADGERSIVYVNNDESFYLTAKQVFPIGTKSKKLWIMDCELVDRLYVFDVMYADGKSLVSEPFSERSKHLEEAAKLIGGKVKPLVKLDETTYRKEIPALYNRKKRPYPIDGLLFTRSDQSYYKTNIYKWKPVEQMTIDFLILEPLPKMMGVEPFIKKSGHKMYFLFCGISYDSFKRLGLRRVKNYQEIVGRLGRDDFFPIQFSPTDSPYAYIYYHPTGKQSISGKRKTSAATGDLAGHVAEFGYKDGTWKLHRMRPDKDNDVLVNRSFGNSFMVADNVWQNYRKPLTLEEMVTETPAGNYFATKKTAIYAPQTNFNSFVKSTIVRNTFKNANFVVDLAAGNGQDMFRLQKAGVKRGLFIDIDAAAVAEMNQRKYELRSLKPQTLQLDLTKPAAVNLAEIQKLGVPMADGVMMNFAIHYVAINQTKLRNLISLIYSLLRVGGRVMITCLSGERVFHLLEGVDPGQAWNSYEGPVLKYSIRKDYRSPRLTKYGQRIGVKLPFSGGEYYEENLVNISNLVTEFARHKLEHEINRSFEEYLEQYSREDKKHYDMLNEEDKKYVSLYQVLTFYKIK